jgi:preprotein translocase subunit YajC
LTGLYNFLFFLQVGQGEAAPAAAPAAQEGAQQATNGGGLGSACGGQGMGIEFIIWMVFLFGLMYFLLIRPQKKQRQQHDEMIKSLKKGDRVMTTGGIMGTLRGLSDTVATVEIADSTNIRIRRDHIAGLQSDPKAAEVKK